MSSPGTRLTPPFRADHVGSLLRPPELLAARARHAAGELDDAGLRAVEDEAVRAAVELQRDVGLQSATDGEFRRTSWHMDFIYRLGGVTRVPEEKIAVHFHSDEGDIDAVFSGMHVDGKLGIDEPIFGDDFAFLRDTVSTAVREADDPVAEHGPLPRRSRLDRPGRVPRPRRLLGGSHRRLPRRGAPARRARLHATSSWTTRASRTSTTRASGSTSPRSAAIPNGSTSSTSTTSTRRSPAGRRAWR